MENPYKVDISANLVKTIKHLHAAAVANDQGDQFIQALEIIEARLQLEPFDFGDPLYRLPNLHVIVYIKVVRPIAIDYSVHVQLPFVFLRSCRLMLPS